MHIIAWHLLILAGLAFCAAGLQRWRSLGEKTQTPVAPLRAWTGMGLLSAAVICAFLDRGGHVRMLYGTLGAWATVASAFFLAGWLRMPGPGLLMLPAGGLALLVSALALLERPDAAWREDLHWFGLLHIVFMSGHMAMAVLALSAAALWMATSQRLKHASPEALRLPGLPGLSRAAELGLVLSTALLTGGIATGGAALRLREDFQIGPVVYLGCAQLLLLCVILGLRALRHLSTRALMSSCLAVAVVLCATVITLFVDSRHG